ncbi:hypothetical protein TVAG_259390 [Trichomonas vaginalis G3]|uniref:RGS domain-containing protein n=1 Tax=Trichomonas vaginalis (strain ATCC PRA-98 / G3) TaxID=412133 RepID=A2EBZ0_TRIV3|nr:regulator of G-protein signaling, RGS family [Trichomonas vaginalis G3]EAY09858.1 hypothetical protein TVAG_259390 [Trichomonas vaginalis G3]KAI5505913.1 regulator of G-protein signaling, RGS family [Trichomonas vaginalis G3]|eukprot:XP_001322081.1 hypothetical protein [Trichomonas vaginalis G3]
MDCVSLAKRLAAKRASSNAPISPVKHRLSVDAPPLPTKRENRTPSKENIPDNPIFLSDTKGVLSDSNSDYYHYVPPIERIFEDANLHRYFKRFLAERKLESVLDFLENARNYKKQFPSVPAQQIKKHRAVVEQLGRIPASFLKSASKGSHKMSSVTAESFDDTIFYILEELNEKEYHSFSNSVLFTKWVLKYHNCGK